MKSFFKIPLIALFLISLISCASTPQLPVNFGSNTKNEIKSIVVIVSETPTPQMNYPGASCLLCLAAAAAGNGSLSSHAKTLSNDEITAFTEEAIAALKAKDIETKLISPEITLKSLKKFSSKEINVAKKDFTSLQVGQQASHALVLNWTYAGISRDYASYIPTSVPYASLYGTMYLVDLTDNSYTWYQPVAARAYAEGQWKQSDEGFPNLTNAYYEQLEKTKETLLETLNDI